MSKIILICGKICSGKSFYADKIKIKEKAVILNTDELTFALFDNEQGEKYEDRVNRANNYLMKKAVELVKVECNVILDWGFWTKKQRNEVTEYFKSKNINIEWHYIDIENDLWEENINERNKKIEAGNGGSDFYITDGLKKKILDKFEEPSKCEIDVWYCFKRDK